MLVTHTAVSKLKYLAHCPLRGS